MACPSNDLAAPWRRHTPGDGAQRLLLLLGVLPVRDPLVPFCARFLALPLSLRVGRYDRIREGPYPVPAKPALPRQRGGARVTVFTGLTSRGQRGVESVGWSKGGNGGAEEPEKAGVAQQPTASLNGMRRSEKAEVIENA